MEAGTRFILGTSSGRRQERNEHGRDAENGKGEGRARKEPVRKQQLLDMRRKSRAENLVLDKFAKAIQVDQIKLLKDCVEYRLSRLNTAQPAQTCPRNNFNGGLL